MSDSLPVLLREAVDEDVDFLMSTWLHEYRRSRRMDDVRKSDYFAGQHKVLEDLLERSVITVACSPEDPSWILGYICGEHFHNCNIVHMVLVKGATAHNESYQKNGIGKLLFQDFIKNRGDLPLYYTHATKLTNQRSKKEVAQRGQLRAGGTGIPDDRGWLREKLKELDARYNPFFAYLTHKQLGVEKPQKYKCPKCGELSHRSY